MNSEDFKSIDDLLFLGDAIDTFQGDVCIGLENMITRGGTSYSKGEGEKLVGDLKRINDKTVIFVVFSHPPPSQVAQSLINNIGVGAVEEEIGLLYYDLDDEKPLYAIEVPDSMITKKGQVKENPFLLLERMKKDLEETKKGTS